MRKFCSRICNGEPVEEATSDEDGATDGEEKGNQEGDIPP
jgi:hypothetical protein